MSKAKLFLQRSTGKPQSTRDGKVITRRSDIRGCTNVFGIQCRNGEQLHVAFSMDCYDQGFINWVTSNRRICSKLVSDLITDTLKKRYLAPDSLRAKCSD